MKRSYYQRKFGKTTVTISCNGYICILGERLSNQGLIYPHAIDPFKRGVINPCTGFPMQVIGMDSQPAETHIRWIYDKIDRGYFDHLIPEGSK